MNKKGITFVIAGFLAIGAITGFSYANTKNETLKEDKTVKIETKLEEKEMIKRMKENGFKDLAKALEKKDYETMDEFMNNITEEDYQKMTEIMRASGYDSMANMMESVGREDMIQMHNAMGGAKTCHGDNNTEMMGSF